MANVQYYGNLIAKLNGEILKQQCAITIHDEVNKRLRITIKSAVPFDGPELVSQVRIGNKLRIGVHVGSWRAVGAPILDIDATVIECSYSNPNEQALQSFTVEHTTKAEDSERPADP